MRQEINILWLEDDLTMDAHTYRKELVEDILKDKGYEAQIREFRTFEDARRELVSVKRYDFFYFRF